MRNKVAYITIKKLTPVYAADSLAALSPMEGSRGLACMGGGPRE